MIDLHVMRISKQNYKKYPQSITYQYIHHTWMLVETASYFSVLEKKNVALQRCYEFVTCSLVILYIKRGKLYILWVWRASKSTQHFVQVYFGTQKFDNTYHLCQQPSGKGGRSSRLMLIFSPFKSLRRLMLLNLGNICTIIVVIF